MSPATSAPAKRRTRSKAAPDQVAADAVQLAYDALVDVVGENGVGDHLGVIRDSDRVVIHIFEAYHAGYHGWTWRVMVARASRARVATVCDSWLEPGDGALLPPAWVPWADRLRPGDVAATDRLAYVPDDHRLMEGYQATEDSDSDQLAIFELGLGRARVLSGEGRAEAAERWLASDRGPESRAARRAGGTCSGCGFFVPMAGSLRQSFGVCANEWSAADGQVVATDYGCGAHSETDVAESVSAAAEPVLDEAGYDVITDTDLEDEETPAADGSSAEPAEAEAAEPDPTQPASGTVEAAEQPEGSSSAGIAEPLLDAAAFGSDAEALLANADHAAPQEESAEPEDGSDLVAVLDGQTAIELPHETVENDSRSGQLPGDGEVIAADDEGER